MDNINQFLRMLSYEERVAASRLESVEKELLEYDSKNGSIVIKKINGYLYYYEQRLEGDKFHSKSLGAVHPGSIADKELQILRRKELEEEKSRLLLLLDQIHDTQKRAGEALKKQPILKDYLFETYWKDEITARVYVKKNEIIVSRFTDHPLKQLFANNRMTRNQLNRIFELRCWDQGRTDLPMLLRGIGLSEYNPQEIVRRTHGVTWNDYIWFRFPGEKLTCKDVLVRPLADTRLD